MSFGPAKSSDIGIDNHLLGSPTIHPLDAPLPSVTEQTCGRVFARCPSGTSTDHAFECDARLSYDPIGGRVFGGILATFSALRERAKHFDTRPESARPESNAGTVRP